MSYAIMRTKKLKMGGLAASLSHTFRERDTPNADPDRLNQNGLIGAQNTDEAMGKIRSALPEKFRKDAVVTIEYLVTTSPEWMEKASREEQNAYFQTSMNWITDKHGKSNVKFAAVHRDEKTPHMVAYVVPNTADGRLCAKDFLGGKAKLSQMQSDFAKAVQSHGLNRGIQGSTAKHERIKKHYAQINQGADSKLDLTIDPSEIESQRIYKEGDSQKYRETPTGIANRLGHKIQAHVAPLVKKASDRDEAQKRALEAERKAESLSLVNQAFSELMGGLEPEQRHQLSDLASSFREQNKKQKIQLALEQRKQLEQQKQQKQQSKGPKLGM